jgi:glycosyltransferase involved in cell wall biosynthesis
MVAAGSEYPGVQHGRSLPCSSVRTGRPPFLFVVTLAEVGGAQSYVRDLLPAVAEEFDVSVAAHGDGPLRAACREHGVPFIPLRHVRRAVSPRDAVGLIELAALFRRLRPAIVHLNSSKAGILGRLAAPIARVPSRVFTVHGWAFKAGHGRASTVYRFADRLVEPLTTTVICVSETERAAGLAARTCVPERTEVILNAVDPGPPPARERPAGEGPVELVSVGRLAEPKDFATLVEAFAELDPGAARLRILGDGPGREGLQRQIDDLGVAGSVELVGEVDDVPERLRRADVFVLSSRSEGMPMSVLEAMAAGLPVVSSDVGGVHEAVADGETGLLVPPASARELGIALRRLVEDRPLRERLGAAGRRRVEERFALPAWRERHLALYRRLLASAS